MKTLAWIRQISQVVFRGNSWKMYPNPNFFTQLSLVTFVTNSTSGFSISFKLGPKLWIPIKCSLGTHFEGKFVYLSFISQISKSPFLVNQGILSAGSKILLLKFDSVCTCLSARFIWGQESFSSRSDVFRQLHFHAQIYWKWYKLYSMFTIIIGGSKQNCAQSPLQAHFWSAPSNLFKTSLWQEFVAAFNGKNFGRCEIAVSLAALEQIACSLCLGSFIYIRQLKKGLTLDNFWLFPQ